MCSFSLALHFVNIYISIYADDGGDEILRVVKVDMKLKTNGPVHRTDKFDLMTREYDPHLVIRRGQDFHIEIAFNRPFKDDDGVSILFSIAGTKHTFY